MGNMPLAPVKYKLVAIEYVANALLAPAWSFPRGGLTDMASVVGLRILMPHVVGPARDAVWAALQLSPEGHDTLHPEAIEFVCE
jgi:hypothetical protein